MSAKFKNIIDYFKQHKGVTVAIIACLIVFTLCVGVIAYAAAYSKILPNVMVGEKNLGGMTREQAEREIAKAFPEGPVCRSVNFIIESNNVVVELDQLDVRINSKKTAEAAFGVGRQGGMFGKTFKMLGLVFGEEKLSPEISLNEQAFEGVIKSLVGEAEVVPEKPSYSLNGDELTIKKGVSQRCNRPICKGNKA